MITDSLEKFEKKNLLLLFVMIYFVKQVIEIPFFFIEDGAKQALIKIYFVEPICIFSTYLE